jgi:hypothetical protein
MADDDLDEWIWRQLAAGTPEQDIILRVSTKTGAFWTDAEERVRRVKDANHGRIGRQQAGWKAALAFFLFLSGAAFLAAAAVPFLWFFTGEKAVPFNAPNLLIVLGQGIYYVVSLSFTGLGMMVGSLIGMRQIWVDILDEMLQKKD